MKATRRAAMKSGLKVAAKVSAALAALPAAALASSQELAAIPGTPGPQIVQFFNGVHRGRQTFVIVCHSIEQWKELVANEPFLERFHVGRLSSGVVATASFNTRETLRKFEILDPTDEMWARHPEHLEGLRKQWDWLERSAIAQRFAER